ncbi:MAG TPA: biotin transporter BioY [Methylomirabilota bacterium]|nr:biotin transporter BioY [Methylomirabilota bacterium]
MITMADAIRPSFARPRADAVGAPTSGARATAVSLLYEILVVLAGSALIALSAWVAIPLPFSPVPVTGQTFAVLFVGSALGARRGAASALAYLAEGACGLPVFAGGAAGPHVLAGPTGGYLAGFVLGAFLCGALAERGWDRRPLSTIASMALGNVMILVPGVIQLSRFVGPEHVWRLGLLPFIPGDIVKIALAAALLPLGWKILQGARLR